jgi:small subunit ribosomal protein S20
MPTTLTAARELRVSRRRTEINRNRRSRVRTLIKKVESAIVEGNKAAAQTALRTAQPEMFRAVNKGLFHKNTMSRKMSRLAASIGKLTA